MTIKHRIINNPSGYHSKGATHKDKVINFATFIKDFGWTGGWRIDDDSMILHLNATNGDNEKIDIEWPESQWWPDVWYTFAGHTIKCRNISHAAKLAQEPPDPDTMRRIVARRRRVSLPAPRSGARGPVGDPGATGVGSGLPTGSEALRVDPTATTEQIIASLATDLPWDAEYTAKEVKQYVLKSSVTWVNRLTGIAHTAWVKPRHFKITTNSEGKMIINFADDYGFHSVYVDSIIGVR